MPRKPPTHPFALLLLRLVAVPAATLLAGGAMYAALAGVTKGRVPLPTGGKKSLIYVALDASPVAFVAGVTFWLALGTVLLFGAWRLATARVPDQAPRESSAPGSDGRMTPKRFFAYGAALLILATVLRMLAADGTILMVLYVVIMPAIVVGIALIAWSAILLMVRRSE